MGGRLPALTPVQLLIAQLRGADFPTGRVEPRRWRGPAAPAAAAASSAKRLSCFSPAGPTPNNALGAFGPQLCKHVARETRALGHCPALVGRCHSYILEKRREGKESVRTLRSRGSPYIIKKNK